MVFTNSHGCSTSEFFHNFGGKCPEGGVFSSLALALGAADGATEL